MRLVGSALLRELFDRGVPVLWFSFGGWFSGVATGMPPGNVELRQRQYRAATVGAGELAAAFVSGKIRNTRTLLRRQARPQPKAALKQLAALARDASSERALDTLLGIEGAAARIYFQHFGRLVRKGNEMGEFDFTGRNRRPPADRVNALLSFAYSMLTKDTVVACLAAGLDPYAGLYHRPRFGRPALALDIAEEFRRSRGRLNGPNSHQQRRDRAWRFRRASGRRLAHGRRAQEIHPGIRASNAGGAQAPDLRLPSKLSS